MAEAARRTRSLNLGRDLDLDQFFPTPDAPTNWPAPPTGLPPATKPAPAKVSAPSTNAAPANTTSAVSTNRSTAVAVLPSTQNPADRQSDKVKALKLQDGDISIQ